MSLFFAAPLAMQVLIVLTAFMFAFAWAYVLRRLVRNFQSVFGALTEPRDPTPEMR